jgi:aryl-alcohol dehydrogenase-like predicted oxidoreductase
LLTGKYARDSRPADGRITTQKAHLLEDAPWDAIDSYAAFCAERDITMVQATFAWMLAQPNLSSVIAGATRPQQVAQNAAAGTAWKPSPEEVQQIAGIFDGEPAA